MTTHAGDVMNQIVTELNKWSSILTVTPIVQEESNPDMSYPNRDGTLSCLVMPRDMVRVIKITVKATDIRAIDILSQE